MRILGTRGAGFIRSHLLDILMQNEKKMCIKCSDGSSLDLLCA